MSGLVALLVLAQAASPAKAVDFGVGTLTLPEGCTHTPGENIDSAIGTFICGARKSRIRYDISGRRGGPWDVRGYCTGHPQEPEFSPSLVTELRIRDGRTLLVCELPRMGNEPARLVAVLSPYASFHVYGTTPADATWLLTVALAFRPR